MPKFEVGDEVVLKPRQKGWRDMHPLYVPAMDKACESGRVFTVRSVGAGLVNIGGYNTLPEWIEHYKPSLDNI